MELKSYVDNTENEKLHNKIKKLESQVKKLNQENSQLKAKVNNLESTVEKICHELKVGGFYGEKKENYEKNEKNLNNSLKNSLKNSLNNSQPPLNSDEENEETWLYYIKKGISTKEIKSKLGLTENVLIIELSTPWSDEESLMKQLLKLFPKFAEFSSIYDKKELKNFLQSVISSNLVNDLCIILRNIPKKSENNYDNIISGIATLAEVMSKSWTELEANDELFGKMALVMESEEEIQILQITKDNTRLLLFVELLFN
jgi:hypothetical protein